MAPVPVAPLSLGELGPCMTEVSFPSIPCALPGNQMFRDGE